MTAPVGPELRDIHLPPAPGWWPPAPGWWVLAALGLACIVFVFYTLSKARRRRLQRRAILAELEHCVRRAGDDRIALAAELSQFLRRMALRADPPAAALHGDAWLAWLDAHGDDAAFSHGVGRALLDAPYRNAVTFDAPALTALVRRWTQRALEEGRAHA